MDAQQKLDQFRAILKDQNENEQAAIFGSTVDISQELRVVTIDLTAAKLSTEPMEIGFPFKGFIAIDGTDSNVSLNMQIATRDSFQDFLPIKKGSSLKLPFPVRKAFLSWTAQSGKSLTLAFFLRGEFSTNILNLVNSGGVSITDGDSVAVQSTATVTTTAASLFATDTTRKKMMIMNYGGSSIFIGDSAVQDDTVGNTKMGIELAPGASFAWESTSACYAIAKGSNNAKIALVKFS